MKKNNNKIIILIVIIVILVSLIISICYIWRNGKTSVTSKITQDNNNIISEKLSSKDIAKYTEASSETVETEAVNMYINDILSILKDKDYKKFFEKLDDDFIVANNLSEYNIQEYLDKNGFLAGEPSANFKEVNFYSEKNDVYVYRVRFYFGRNTRYINIIETSPYNYKINLEQKTVPKVYNNSFNVKVDDIEFQITESEKREDCLIYNVKITNYSDKKVTFDFTSINNVVLAMNGDGTIKQPSSILEAGTDYSLNKDSYFTKSFYFPINMQYHKDVIGFNFYNVKIGNVMKNIFVRF